MVSDTTAFSHTHCAADASQSSDDEETILIARDERVDQGQNTKTNEAAEEDELGREEVGQSAGEEESACKCERVGREDLASAVDTVPDVPRPSGSMAA